jgi:hypothetical protein
VYGKAAFGSGDPTALDLLQPYVDPRPSPTAPAGQTQPDPYTVPDAAQTDPQASGLLSGIDPNAVQDPGQGQYVQGGPTATELLAQQQSTQPPPTQQTNYPGNIRPELLGVA